MSDRVPIVYIVDDDEVTRRYFDAVLSSANVGCCRVESAAAFLEMYDPEQPGCLLLDVQMPGTLQGARDVAPQDNCEVNQQQSNRSTNIKEKEFHRSPPEPSHWCNCRCGRPYGQPSDGVSRLRIQGPATYLLWEMAGGFGKDCNAETPGSECLRRPSNHQQAPVGAFTMLTSSSGSAAFQSMAPPAARRSSMNTDRGAGRQTTAA